MKRVLESGLVITLTIITVFAMLMVKTPVIQDEQVFVEEGDMEEELGKPEGTGYLFEDYDRGINIPFEGQENIQEEDKESKYDTPRLEDFKRIGDSSRIKIKEYAASSVIRNESVNTSNVTNDLRGESKVIISKVKNNISLEDKLSLLKIVSKLSLKDLNDIKNAILNGTTNAESIKLWTMLRSKLPHEQYKKLENIITKYE